MALSELTDTEFPAWMDRADVGTIAAVTLDDGEHLTAEVREFDDERNELIVGVVSSNRTHPNHIKEGRAIPIRRILAFEPQLRAEQPWPYSDPCRGTSFSFARFILMTTLFLCLTVGSVPLFLLLTEWPYGFQAASAITCTLFAVFLTFARTGNGVGKDVPPYLFTCPAVQPQFLRLLWRHLGFLVTLFALQTLALTMRPSLPSWWNTDNRRTTPFETVLLLLCLGLAYAEVFTNRRLLERAHREFSP